eukprot:CAMPEP_0182510432 /NCGR_PEP_ID=MMETSP1321-20130603/28659_1 /TAXON_ID=91990 /ORGANISM="Bolidomonas sp., Strain RCC1657" /LENGTH=128 /DNA_ID=CAMNT_0024716885 /DNA_START=345 /DNA_END=728 /DNA_ORIENTATION=-
MRKWVRYWRGGERGKRRRGIGKERKRVKQLQSSKKKILGEKRGSMSPSSPTPTTPFFLTMSGAILLLASPTFSSLVLLLALEGDFDLPPPFDFFTLVGFLAFTEIGEGLLLARSFERAARPFFDLGAR